MNQDHPELAAPVRPSLLRSFVGDSLIALIFGMLANIFNYLFLMWAGRSLPALSFGLFATGVTIFTLVAVLSNAVQMRVTQLLMECSTEQCQAFIGGYLKRLTTFMAALSIVLWLAGDWLYGHIGAAGSDLAALNLGIASMGLYACFMGYLGARHHLRTQAAGNVVGALLKFAVALLLSISGSAVALWLASYSVHFGAIIAGGLWWWWRERTQQPWVSEGRGAPDPRISVCGILWHVAPLVLGVFPFVADQWYVRVLAQEQSGSYGALTTLAKVSFYACGPLFVVVLPYVLRAREGKASLAPILALSLAVTAMIGGAASGFMTLFPEEFTTLCYGGRYIEVSVFLPLSSWTMTIYAFNYLGLVVAFALQSNARSRLVFCALLLVPIGYQYLGMLHGGDLLGLEGYVRRSIDSQTEAGGVDTLVHVVSVHATTLIIQFAMIVGFFIGVLISRSPKKSFCSR
jgi:O-antigen/teichoic acid export membrane protein